MLSRKERLERDELFKVGDVVTIRSLDDMIDEFGKDDGYCCGPDVLYHFPDTMNSYCGQSYKITDKILNVDGTGYKYWLDTVDTDMKEVGYERYYLFSSDMFKLPKKKKNSTTKKDSSTKFNDMEKDFKIFSKQAEKFIQKWGHPYRKIIIDQNGIEVVDGVKAKPFEIND